MTRKKLQYVDALMEHSGLRMTQRYAHVKDEHLRLALEGLKTDDIPLPDAIQTPSDNVM
jgi:hypothetical protein